MIDNTTIITRIAKSRKILLELLEKRGYDVNNYNNFTINEINILYQQDSLDILLENEKGNKIKIIYYLHKILRPNIVMDLTEDLFNVTNTLKLNDELIIIQNVEPNESLINCLINQYNEKGYYINIFNLDRLQFNILNHTLVPEHKILSDEELDKIKKEYNITKNIQFPEISRFDPVSMVIGLRPGNVCEILRNSETSLNSKYYRICS